MDYSLMTCRFCQKSGFNHTDFVKYSVRHYAHHDCYLNAGKKLAALADWQLDNFPRAILKKHKLLAEAKAIIEERGEQRSRNRRA